MRAENDPVFTEWLKRKNNKYTSPEIQNEILKELALTILRDVVELIKAADFFSIMLDESGDISNKDAKDSLLRFDFDKEKLRGQCYDGCSTMMGKKTGVSKQKMMSSLLLFQPIAMRTH